MPSIFSLNKKTSSILLISLGLLLNSLPLIQSKPNSNLRSLSAQDQSAEPNPRLLPDDNSGDDDDNEENGPDGPSKSGTNTDAGYGCWIESYGRGVGKPLSTCPAGSEKNGLLCYPNCGDGYTGNGPVCWQNCPGGFTDTGADCLKPGSYGRGAGYALWDLSKCQSDNPQGCEQNGLLYYPKCGDGFHNVGCCVCSPNCINGMTDIGVSCQKDSYGRGVGSPMSCPDGQDEDAALCYTKCRSGWSGDGPVCWGACPSGMYKCGALCLESEDKCVAEMFNIANEVLNGIVSYAGGEDDTFGAMINAAQSGVQLTEEMAKYKTCTNM